MRRNSFVLLLLLAACGGKKQVPQMPPPEVTVWPVAPQSIVLTTELPGRTTPYLIAEIRPQVSGLIQKRLFTEGSEVKVGDVLYQIDPAPYQAALDKAAANQATLKAKADRLKEVVASKAVSQQELEDAQAAVKAAEADLEMARINLAYTKIVAPIAGRIGKSSVTDGAILTAYQMVALTTIQQLDPIYVDVPQSTGDLLRLRSRQLKQDGNNTVDLFLEDGSKYPVEGTLQFRDVTVDPATATVTLRMVFPNPDGVLLPGMFVRAIVKEGVNEQAILIPQNAVTRDPKGTPLVLVVNKEGKAEQRTLKTDRAISNQWLVASGLEAGDQVIVEGLQKVRAGMPVKVATK